MKIASIKEGARVFNKINGKVYEVISMPNEMEAREYGEAVTVNPETGALYTPEEPEYDIVQLSEANDICFRKLSVPDDKTVPHGYKVVNGILYSSDDKQVTEQGQIYIERILRALPGYLILAVKPRTDAEGCIDLFAYKPEKDEFKKLIRSSIYDPSYVHKPTNDSVVLGYSRTHMEDVLDENGNPTGEQRKRFDGSAVILVKDCRVDSVFFDRPMDLKSWAAVDGTDDRFYLGSNERVNCEDCVVNDDWYYAEIIIRDDCIDLYSSHLTKSPVTSIAAVNFGDGRNTGVVLKGDNFIRFNDVYIESELVKEMVGPYLVDVTYEDHVVIVTMADKDYKISRIKRQNTKDRGYIVSLI